MKSTAALRSYIAATFTAGALLTCALLLDDSLPTTLSGWLLAAVFLLLSAASTHYVLHFAPGVNFETNTLVFFAAVLLFPPGLASLIAGLGSFVGNSLLRQSIKQRCFNSGMCMLLTAGSGMVLSLFAAVPWSPQGVLAWIGLVLAAVVMQAINMVLISGIIAIQRHIAFTSTLRRLLSVSPTDLVIYGLGLMAAILARTYPWALVLMIIPAVALFIAVKRILASRQQQETLAQQNGELVVSLQNQTEELQKTVALLETALTENQNINQSLAREINQRIEAELALITAYDTTLEGLSRALELRDQDTLGHCQNVTGLTLLLAERMGIAESSRADIRRGTLLHDIGKIGIPDAILRKPSPLDQAEWEVMRRHPVYGYQILSSIEFLRGALDIPYCHHERWDGSGYPRGLRGDEIPLPARMFAVVDVWDALRSDRPYRQAWSDERAREYIIAQSGRHFDPQVVQVFLRMLDEQHAPAIPADIPALSVN